MRSRFPTREIVRRSLTDTRPRTNARAINHIEGEFYPLSYGGETVIGMFETNPRRTVHAGRFNAPVSTGCLRKRLPVAAKIALVTAGATAEVPVSPIPPGGSEL
jgi:hypothetical protein